MENLALVFGLSFLTALSGAMQPGPLLTYTIVQSLHARRRGWLIGARIIAGHAVLELVLVIAILLGFSLILTNPVTVTVIGVAGTLFLLFLALMVFRDVFVKKVDLPGKEEVTEKEKKNFLRYPVVGGALVSMSNPFWWVWWATIGFFFMRAYSVSLAHPLLLASFFLGHELGDLSWYSLVSTVVFSSRRWFTRRVYHVVLIGTAVFLIALAGYMLYATLVYKE